MALSLTIETTHTKTLVSPSTGTDDKVYGADYVSVTSHTSAVTSLSGTLDIANGGTGAATAGAAATALGVGTGNSPTFVGLTLSGLTSGRVALIGASGVLTDNSGLTYASGLLTAGALTLGSASPPAGSQGQFYQGANATQIEFGSSTPVFRFLQGEIDCVGNANIMWTNTTNTFSAASIVSAISGGRLSNALIFGGSSASSGGATTRVEINKSVTGIADNTATATFTVTVPNAAHSASIRVRLTGSMGAGGAIGANESNQDAEYMINVARTAGVNAVATIGAVVGQAAAAAVAGAGTVVVTGELSAISGAVGATNTFTINVKIVKSGGSSANHTCFAFAELLNANSSGVTIA